VLYIGPPHTIGDPALLLVDDHHAQYLTPSFALSGLAPGASAYDNMSQADLETYLKEMESDIRSADRDMREIEALEAKGATGAGKLAGEYLLKLRS